MAPDAEEFAIKYLSASEPLDLLSETVRSLSPPGANIFSVIGSGDVPIALASLGYDVKAVDIDGGQALLLLVKMELLKEGKLGETFRENGDGSLANLEKATRKALELRPELLPYAKVGGWDGGRRGSLAAPSESLLVPDCELSYALSKGGAAMPDLRTERTANWVYERAEPAAAGRIEVYVGDALEKGRELRCDGYHLMEIGKWLNRDGRETEFIRFLHDFPAWKILHVEEGAYLGALDGRRVALGDRVKPGRPMEYLVIGKPGAITADNHSFNPNAPETTA